MQEYKSLKYVAADGLITITVDRPPLNVLDIPTMVELEQAIGIAAADPTVKLLALTGAGEKVFSAGVDVLDHTPDKVDRMIETFHAMLTRIKDFPVPTVGLLNGSAMGGGCEFMLACDMALAVEGCKIGQPEIKLGVFPTFAVIMMAKQLPMTKAMELLLGGGLIGADEAKALGMVNHVYPRASFAADSKAFMDQFLGLSRVALQYTKRAIREGYSKPFNEAMVSLEHLYLKELMGTADAHEGLAAFIEKRKPVWTNK